ncbi:MAG: glutamate synthase-related protein, partial [Caulobacterales bacterium]|nr:glutamate synthase-related protein [Caulobacterales bacterium]
HSNTCPVGVCTQDEALREHFTGAPDHVVRLMTFLAEEVREILARLGAKSLDDVIGRTDLLDQISRGADHLDDLDLNPLLARIDPHWRPRPREYPQGRVEVPDSLDASILRDAAPVFRRGEKMQLTYTVRNVERAIGARVSSEIVRAKGAGGFPDNHLTVSLRGSAGQSLGAFGARGLRLEVEGDANDYVGKGLSGAIIVVAPRRTAADGGKPYADAVIGNTCLYGATAGELYAAGCAGERFAVRNSGARAVVEGVSANGCEYMTGGAVVILGEVGDNFAAGMTGGEAFVYDPKDDIGAVTNFDSVLVGRFADDAAAERCRTLIAAHARATGSVFARRLLDNWDVERGRFVQVLPKEIAAREGVELPSVA